MVFVKSPVSATVGSLVTLKSRFFSVGGNDRVKMVMPMTTVPRTHVHHQVTPPTPFRPNHRHR